ncbi:MAG: aldolase [Actinomycetia bacterium]|nr:aldolase [Actinomycetes bacterium]
MSDSRSDFGSVLTDDRWAELLELRATQPALIAARAAERRRRPLLGVDGRLFLLAADHTARGMTGIAGAPFVMADRRDQLERLLIGLADPRVDGLLGSPDILEELLLLGELNDKVVIGTMNRGGLQGAVWELDDPFTAYSPAVIAEANLDGGKMLLRLDHNDPGTLPTLEASADAVSGLASRGLLAMIEPLPYTKNPDGRAVLLDDDDALVRAVGVANSLGATSAHTWLKVPSTDQVERVMAATTLPTLILGGAPGPDPETAFASWERALRIPQVRGLTVGRTLLYPTGGDVAAAVAAAGAVVHPEIPSLSEN